VVLINGVHEQFLRRLADQDSARGGPLATRQERVSQWFRTRAASTCDGGELFFRAEYDVAADAISAFTFNARG
jgi:hypothetical protein